MRPTGRAAVLLLLTIAAGCGGGGERPARSSAIASSSPPAESATAAPAPSARPDAAGAASPGARDTAWLAAVQALLDYYRDINDQHYDAAYRRWAGGGAASHQTPAEFQRGFASTVRVSVLVPEDGDVVATGDSVRVPVQLYSVVNQSGARQAVKRFAGSYTLRRTGPTGGAPGTGATGDAAANWEIAGASITAAPGPLPPPGTAEPAATLDAYFQAINGKDFARAYTLWDDLGRSSSQTLPDFAAGFAATAHDEVRLGEPSEDAGAGNLWATVPVALLATTTAGVKQAFCGTMTLHRANLVPWDSLGWRIARAELRSVEEKTGAGAAARMPPVGCGS